MLVVEETLDDFEEEVPDDEEVEVDTAEEVVEAAIVAAVAALIELVEPELEAVLTDDVVVEEEAQLSQNRLHQKLLTAALLLLMSLRFATAAAEVEAPVTLAVAVLETVKVVGTVTDCETMPLKEGPAATVEAAEI